MMILPKLIVLQVLHQFIDSQAQTSSAINVSIKVVQPHETQSNLTEILLPINSDEVLMNTSPLWDIDDGTTYLVEYPNLNLFKFFDSALVSILEKSIKLPGPPLNDNNKIMKSIKTQIFPLSNSVGTINATDQLLSEFPSSTPSVKYNRTAHSNVISNKSDIFDTLKNDSKLSKLFNHKYAYEYLAFSTYSYYNFIQSVLLLFF